MRIRWPRSKAKELEQLPAPDDATVRAMTLARAEAGRPVLNPHQAGPAAVFGNETDVLSWVKTQVETSERAVERGLDRDYFKGPPIVEETQARPKAIQNPSQMGMSALSAVRAEQPAPKRRLRIVRDD